MDKRDRCISDHLGFVDGHAPSLELGVSTEPLAGHVSKSVDDGAQL